MAVCDPADVAEVERALARTPFDLGIGVIDVATGVVRVFPYNETDAFSAANPALQVMAGHEAAATMAGVSLDRARGFLLNKQRAGSSATSRTSTGPTRNPIECSWIRTRSPRSSPPWTPPACGR